MTTEGKAIKLPSKKTITGLLTDCRQLAGRITEITGELGAAVAAACTKKHVNKTALSMYRRLDKMSDEKAAEVWAHLLFYVTEAPHSAQSKQTLEQRWGAQGQMFGGKDEDEEVPSERPPAAGKEDDPRPEFLKKRTAEAEEAISQVGRGGTTPNPDAKH